MKKTADKTPAGSAVESRYLIMPNHTNPYGTAFGGVIMAWIDMVGSMAARKHCGREVVTASIDSISFRAPAYAGDQVVLKAMVNYAGRTSMEVGVIVIREDPETGESQVTTTAHLTFVALDANKRPCAVPAIVPKTDEEVRRYHNAMLRVETRKALLAKLRKDGD